MSTGKRTAVKWRFVLFPVVLIITSSVALARSGGPDALELTVGVLLALAIITAATWAVLRRNKRQKEILAPVLAAARTAGSTGCLYMRSGKSGVGLALVRPSRELRLFDVKHRKARLCAMFPAGSYTLSTAAFTVNATTQVDGLGISVPESSDSMTLLVLREDKQQDEKSHAAGVIAAMVSASSAAGRS